MARTAREAAAKLAHRFSIERELESGGDFSMFRCTDRSSGSPVRLRVFPSGATSAELNRAADAARLQHANIVPVLDSGEAAGLLYLVSPLRHGETLRERLNRAGELTVPEIVSILRGATDALAYAHASAVVHGQLKPEDVFLADDHTLLAGFGEPLPGQRREHDPDPYSAPELQRRDAEPDHRSDIYSLGAVMFEALLAHTPRGSMQDASASSDSLEQQILRARPGVPQALASAIARCLAPVPAERWQSASELAERLAFDHTDPPPNGVGRTRGLRVAAGALLLVAVAAAAVLLRRPTLQLAGRTIAVMPFASEGGDSADAALGREVALLLAYALDAVDSVRGVDARLSRGVQAPADSSRPGLTPTGAAERAAMQISGTVSRARPGLRIRLTVHDGTRTRSPVEITANLAVLPPRQVADSLARRLLRRASGSPPAPAKSVASLLSPEDAALRAFADAELVALAQPDSALALYSNALQLDSSFTLARFRAHHLHRMLGKPDTALTEPNYGDSTRLPRRELQLLRISRVESAAERIALLRQLAEAEPGFVEGWYELADDLAHRGALLGHSAAEARSASRAVLRLLPASVPAREQLLALLVAADSTTAVLRLLGLPLSADTLTLQLAIAGAIPFSALGDSLVRLWSYIPKPPVAAASFLLRRAQLDSGSAGSGRWDSLRAALRPALYAQRGAWDSALVELSRRTLPRALQQHGAVETFRMAVLGVVSGALTPDSALQVIPPVLPATAPASLRAETAWLEGLVAFAQVDGRGLARARAEAQASESEYGPLLVRSLDAFATYLADDVAGAAHALSALEDELASRGDSAILASHPAFRSVNRTVAVDWLLASGDTASAERMLLWIAAPGGAGSGMPREPLLPIALLQKARLERARTHEEEALRYYAEFYSYYDIANGRAQTLRGEALRALCAGGVPVVYPCAVADTTRR